MAGGLGGILFDVFAKHGSILRYEYYEGLVFWVVGLSCGVRSVYIEFCKGVGRFIGWGFQDC